MAAVAACLCACDDSRIYSRFVHVDSEAWGRSDTLRFAIATEGDSGVAKARLMLRVSPDYEFRNLSLIVASFAKPKGPKAAIKPLRTDIIECRMADASGHIEGRGVMHRDFSFALPNIGMGIADTLIVAVCHNMRRMEIAGIEEIGIELSRIGTAGK